MTPFIHDHFMLTTAQATRLYHDYAKEEPIFDYHCHLSPKDLAENRQFSNLYEPWLEGDHYKWRAMRIHGTSEHLCTGNASPFDKFKAFAATVPHTLRNPLYHWTHLELSRYFGITEPLSPGTAASIWEQANHQLQQPSHSSWAMLEKFKVQFIGTTDDPCDTLEHHLTLKQSDCPATVAPTFRPDPALAIQQTEAWNQWVDRLGQTVNADINSLDALKSALQSRVDFFDQVGCRSSDHGLSRCPLRIASDSEASSSFLKARTGQQLTADEAEGVAGYLLAFLSELYVAKNWIMQLHLGVIRNVNQGLYQQLGPDLGCDSIGDNAQIPSLSLLLGELSLRNHLPKTILYNLNPSDNYAFATMCGNFFEAGIKAKVQWGSGWWFLDQADGMKWQLNALSQLGLLSHFIGMLTDSRSMMSFPRHEYFRRILCELLGQDMARGALPNDLELIGSMVKNISFSNAQQYFQ